LAHELYRLLRDLEKNHLWFQLHRDRADSVTIAVTAVGERLEIDVFEDGHVEYSRFKGDESVESDLGRLDSLLTELGGD
jgi:hypothetical protein